MKFLFLVMAVTLLFNQSIHSQDINLFGGATSTQPVMEINTIDKLKDEIKNNLSSYQKKEKFKDTTGYRNAFFKGNELLLIAAYYRDTATEKHVDWYFQNGQLIFSEQLWTDRKTNDTLDYERYYLQRERLIAWFKFDKPVDKNSVVFKKLNYRMHDYISELKDDNKK